MRTFDNSVKSDSMSRQPGRRLFPKWIVTGTGLLAVAVLVAGCSSSSTPATTTTTSSSSSTTTPRLSAAAIRVLQAGLAKIGCYTGHVDGVSGPLTTQAVRAFQTASGITADGIYGTATKAKLLAADHAGTRVCPASSVTTTTSASVTTTTASAFPGAPTALVTVITTYESAHGPAAGTWKISSVKVSTADPTYAYFRISPAPGHESTVQGGYGFAHSQGGVWSVIGFGTSEVSCPPDNSQNAAVPAAVLTEFGLSCPAST